MVKTNDSELLTTREISWSAIFAGALVALGLSFLVHAFNLGIGLSAFTTNTEGMVVLAIGGMLWLLLTGIVVMFITGWVTGRLASRFTARPLHGALHGFLAWSLALLIGLAIAATLVTGIVGEHDAGNTLQTIANQATDTAKAITPSKQTKDIANTAGATALATFLVFLFGAASAAVGGYYGVQGKRKIGFDR